MHKCKGLLQILIVSFCLLVIATNSSFAASEDEIKQELSSLVGAHVWFLHEEAGRLRLVDGINNTNEAESLAVFFGKARNLDELTIKSIDFDNATIVLQRPEGQLITWQIDVNKPEYRCYKMQQLLGTVFLFKDPYEQHPDWPYHLWQRIRDCEVEKGMTKDMVLLSKGAPFSDYKDSRWRYMARIYIFEGEYLVGSELTMPLHR